MTGNYTAAKSDYIFQDGEVLAELNARYQELFPKFTAAEAAVQELEAVRAQRAEINGEPASNRERNDLLKLDHKLFVAQTKARMAVLAMHPRLQPLWDACQRARDFDKGNRNEFEHHECMLLLRSNVIVSEILYNKGCAIYFELSYSAVASSVTSLFDLKNEEPREWAVLKAAQGATERFILSHDQSQPPPPPYMTKREANLDAWIWCERAQFDGGTATLYNVRTRQKLSYTDPKTFTNSWGGHAG